MNAAELAAAAERTSHWYHNCLDHGVTLTEFEKGNGLLADAFLATLAAGAGDSVPTQAKLQAIADAAGGVIDADAVDECAGREPAAVPPDIAEARPCSFCGEPCDNLAADPGQWMVEFPHSDGTGKCKPHHMRCVTERLFPAAVPPDIAEGREVLNDLQSELVTYCERFLDGKEPLPTGALEQLLCEHKDSLKQLADLDREEKEFLAGGSTVEFSDEKSGRILDKAKMLIEIDTLRDRLAANEAENRILRARVGEGEAWKQECELANQECERLKADLARLKAAIGPDDDGPFGRLSRAELLGTLRAVPEEPGKQVVGINYNPSEIHDGPP